MYDWAHAGAPFLASFGASTVEFVEATTIVLAVGSVRGWKPALWGAALGVATLTVLVLALGPALGLVPMHLLQIVIGVLLLLFGMRWLRKAVLRAAGIIGLHDEDKIYAKQTAALRAAAQSHRAWDALAIATCFKAVVLEGLEVVFIVIAVGAAGHTLAPACVGAAAAGLFVLLLALAVHRPLARVPENTLKYGVGVMLTAFGVYWVGEGFGFEWPGSDWSIVGLGLAFLAVSLLVVPLARRLAGPVTPPAPSATPPAEGAKVPVAVHGGKS